MKKLYYYILWSILLFLNSATNTFAAAGEFLWVKYNVWKTWDITIDHIPRMLASAIQLFIGFAWTIAVIFIIVWAYKILFGSIEQDKSKWKDTIFMAIWGFVIASLAWFIIRFILDNLTV